MVWVGSCWTWQSFCFGTEFWENARACDGLVVLLEGGGVQCYRDVMKDKVPSVGSRKSRVCATWLKLAMYQAKIPPFGSITAITWVFRSSTVWGTCSENVALHLQLMLKTQLLLRIDLRNQAKIHEALLFMLHARPKDDGDKDGWRLEGRCAHKRCWNPCLIQCQDLTQPGPES